MAKYMKLDFYHRPDPNSPIALGENPAEEVELVLSPHHPTLDMTEVEVGERLTTEVLHVRIQREDGKIAHLHFSVGINNQGQAFGEVSAMHNEPRKQVVRKASAGWREPVKRS